MLYVFSGTDFDKVRKNARAILEKEVAKHSHTTALVFDSQSFTPQSFDECIATQGLFVARCVVDIKDVCETADGKTYLIERLSDMAESENVFVVSERKLDAKILKQFAKHAHKIEEFHQTKKEDKQYTKVFDFANAVAQKDKKRAWQLFCTELREIATGEEVCGTLVWQFKMIALAHVCGSATEAGVSPYAFSQAQKFARGSIKEETFGALRELIEMYHDAHRGQGDLLLGIERWVLGR